MAAMPTWHRICSCILRFQGRRDAGGGVEASPPGCKKKGPARAGPLGPVTPPSRPMSSWPLISDFARMLQNPQSPPSMLGDLNRFRLGALDLPGDGCDGALGCYRVMRFTPAPDGKRVAGNIAADRPLSGFGDAWILLVLIVHQEVLPDPFPLIHVIRSHGKSVGMAVNPDTPVGTLSSPMFGTSTSIHGFGPGAGSANRTIELQTRFSF